MTRVWLLAAALCAAALPAAAQDAIRGAALAEARGCGGCHGPAGRSAVELVPSLAGQPAEFITLQMILLREGLRQAPPMNQLAQGLEDQQVEDLAAYYASLPAGPAEDRAARDAALYARGQALSAQMNCGVCHLPDFSGRNQIPHLAGQREDFLRHTLAQYRDSQRRGTDTNMNAVMYNVPDDAIAALAHFMAQQ
ncbi:c-type cytochrome [Falsiroseomonas selenitidurans]|uniref:C-type cytochrome n=1 Tax=Falsiroseomonas selenitidurans TaxID=2716335 RepID=A0ABX1E622_9PROT|nr:c-type cytochrome [Falsiroseomonas selenitidurans]NKC32626.1 c-type cytochrome [Falsiroseomonas selenitidurans]